MRFTDSVSENLEVVSELLKGVHPAARNRAKRAAMLIEQAWDQVRKESIDSKDPATMLGAAFAIYTLADRMIQNERDGTTAPLIQLLS